MGNRLSKIYTRTGDDGSTGLGDGSRTPKNSPRVTAYGSIDELNSAIGMILATSRVPENLTAYLTQVQHDLFDLGGELSIPGYTTLTEDYTKRLENELDGLNETLPSLKEFILPGGGPGAAACHLARTIARRAERDLLTLAELEPINDQALPYVNRLSDFLFVAARILARQESGSEVFWKSSRASRTQE